MLDGCPDDFVYRPVTHAMRSRPRPRVGARGGGAGLSACRGTGGWVGGWGGRGEGHGSLGGRPTGARTRDSERVISDLHPAVPPPRPH